MSAAHVAKPFNGAGERMCLIARAPQVAKGSRGFIWTLRAPMVIGFLPEMAMPHA